MDETGLALGSTTNNRVLGGSKNKKGKEKKTTYVKNGGNREWVTIECGSPSRS
jgi:hypothetical protein